MNTVNFEKQIYNSNECCAFNKTKEIYGGLSNMAGGFPIVVQGIEIRTSEALFQMCRFPHLPDLQQKMKNEKSPLVAKWVSRPFICDSRPDWNEACVEIMRWCLQVKLAQNFSKFGEILESTGNKPIVEDSRNNDFWGAIRDGEDTTLLLGSNVLGQLLVELRQLYIQNKDSQCIEVLPLNIPNFKLLGQDIPKNTIALIPR